MPMSFSKLKKWCHTCESTSDKPHIEAQPRKKRNIIDQAKMIEQLEGTAKQEFKKVNFL
jgi:hypothetical protein